VVICAVYWYLVEVELQRNYRHKSKLRPNLRGSRYAWGQKGEESAWRS
jgi:hypothetical protein